MKLIQNSSFLFHSHYSPMFPEKKVGENTFRAFTGKLEEPIDWRSGGGGASLEGRLILTSLGHERRASRGYAISTRRWPENYGEKSPFVLLLTKVPHELFCMGDMMRKDDCPVRLFAQRLAESFYLPPLPLPPRLLFQPLMSALSLG